MISRNKKKTKGFKKYFNLGKSIVTTHGYLDVLAPCSLQDLEWNHMDQAHRPHIHNTYTKQHRVFANKTTALSLTSWGKWPVLLNVQDIRVSEGKFLQSLMIFGCIYLELTNTMNQVSENETNLKIEWEISSHWFFRPFHFILNRKIYNLNLRLQDEDLVIRKQRQNLRKNKFRFLSDPPDYVSSNIMSFCTIYPIIESEFTYDVNQISVDERKVISVSDINFILERVSVNEILVWPGECPHQGASLINNCEIVEHNKIKCPWHGLKILPVELSLSSGAVTQYSFIFSLDNNILKISNA